MMRDLRSAPPYPPVSDSSSMAFSRGAISGRGDAPAPAGEAPRTGAFTIAVTAPRMLTCKRGLAAHLGAHLALGGRADGATVCIVDADIESRDLGVRFGVAGPLLLDVAKQVAVGGARPRLDEMVTRVDPPGVWVLPTKPPQSALLPLLHTKMASLLGPLRAGFDYLVVDAPVGIGAEVPDSGRAVLQHVDALLVAVTADPSAIGGALRYLNALAVARNKNVIPSTFSIHLVLTGNDHDSRRVLLDAAQLERKLQGLPVVATVPQLWGRQRPDGPIDPSRDGRLQPVFDTIMHALTTAEPSR